MHTTLKPYLAIMLLLAGQLATGALQAADGATLYTRHCAACHGATGSGGVGVPLSLPDLHAVIDDRYLQETIRLGRPGRVMPAFKQLADDEVNAIVRHVRSFAKPASSTLKIKPPQGNASRGEALYAKHCAACHGARGEGSHGTGVTFSRPREMPVLAPALNNAGFLAAASDSVIKKTLVHGRTGTPMPSFSKQGLTNQNIDDIVAFVRSFGKQLPAATATTAASQEPAILQRTSTRSVAETTERIKEIMTNYNMRIIRAVPFNQGMVDPRDENSQSMIVDGCDFGFLNQALAIDPRVGLFLPCRVSITQHQDKVLVMTINPKRLSTIFNNAELNQMCDEMYKLYNDMLDEAVQ